MLYLIVASDRSDEWQKPKLNLNSWIPAPAIFSPSEDSGVRVWIAASTLKGLSRGKTRLVLWRLEVCSIKKKLDVECLNFQEWKRLF